MGLPTGYNILGYGAMVTSEPRMAAYAQALQSAISPGCSVVDIGAGQGILSILACKYGAGSVVAIEPNDIIQLARQFAEANGCADRITFIQGLSTSYQPTTKADIVISDLRGGLPLFEGHIPTIADARERLLREGGILIPLRDTIRIGLVENAKAYEPHEQPWLKNRYGLDLSAGAAFASSVRTKAVIAPEDLLSEPADLLVLDYCEVTESNVEAHVCLTAKRRGTAHGLQLWFDALLTESIGFSNAPGEPEQIYGQNFFPLARPLDFAPGDRLEVEVTARLIDGSYVWTWSSRVRRAGSHETAELFRQSSFGAKVISTASLRVRSSSFVPAAVEENEIDRFCLSLVDGQRNLGEIADELRARFPRRFQSQSDALSYAVELTLRNR